MEYLRESPTEIAREHWSRNAGNMQPLTHTVHTHDFMGMATHDIPCYVCFDNSAIIHRDVTPGRYKQTIQPCSTCAEQGYATLKLPLYILKRLCWWRRS